MDSSSIVLLLPLGKSGGAWYTRLQELRSELNRKNEALFSFSLSSVFDKMSDLPDAWCQLQYIHMNPAIDTIFSIGQINNVVNKDDFTFNAAVPQMIYDALNAGSGEAACSILVEHTALLKNKETNLLSGLVYNMIHDMLALIKLENAATLADIALPEFVSGQQEALFSKYFPECFRQIGERIKKQHDKSFTKFGQKTIDFINDHLSDPNLYTTMVTEKFDISQPTLQKLVRSMTGQTFLAYIENQRLNKSYEMLSQGTATIQDIALACGFSNANTFYKAFKRKYGFPPSAVFKR
jgi:AraC-like DNA-binding protein